MDTKLTKPVFVKLSEL